ncbi:hypothetical protein KRP22_006199 [Phytophthora ramorum]|nr:hypothetical protein KRP22_2668 [Phytophthora ramorum]
MKRECVSCCELRQELVELRESSEVRAREDHDQCVAIFQQMQELVKMNASLARGSNRSGGRGEDEITYTRSSAASGSVKETVARVNGGEDVGTQIRRLQAIVVQQAKELEAVRRRKRDATADGRVQYAVTTPLGNQLEKIQDSDEENASTDSGNEDALRDFASGRHADQLRKLPLTSLHAQLKGKDLQLKHLQQVNAKLETRFGQLVDRKRSMAQSFQQTARTQQAQLKKYLAYIRQQTLERKALERQARQLNQYVAVLEKKVVDYSFRSSSRHGPEVSGAKLHHDT